ncbi:hypothetical protein [Pseudalkalibacillus caeni]|uniref:Uncharacterized protein n=1 Tax=Exobacillus caeni TaxID=2574798 RepID=A0A5R9F8V5_9BACL|nr:hypothetical protein [Pseudalkalibacillus caeni]TLS38949.1 hypothetical protein FCL54_01155 [Pseudalkalibacillus caeni]
MKKRWTMVSGVLFFLFLMFGIGYGVGASGTVTSSNYMYSTSGGDVKATSTSNSSAVASAISASVWLYKNDVLVKSNRNSRVGTNYAYTAVTSYNAGAGSYYSESLAKASFYDGTSYQDWDAYSIYHSN